MPTPSGLVKKHVYLVLYDRQTPRQGIEYPSPVDNAIQQQTVEITNPVILAKIDELHALIAADNGCERAPAPPPPPSEETSE